MCYFVFYFIFVHWVGFQLPTSTISYCHLTIITIIIIDSFDVDRIAQSIHSQMQSTLKISNILLFGKFDMYYCKLLQITDFRSRFPKPKIDLVFLTFCLQNSKLTNKLICLLFLLCVCVWVACHQKETKYQFQSHSCRQQSHRSNDPLCNISECKPNRNAVFHLFIIFLMFVLFWFEIDSTAFRMINFFFEIVGMSLYLSYGRDS